MSGDREGAAALSSPPLTSPLPLPRAGRSRVLPWTPQEEQELRELYWKYKEVEGTRAPWGGGATGPPWGAVGAPSLQPPALAGEDIIAAILAHLPAPGRTRRQVVKQLVRLGLASSVKDFPRERWVGDPWAGVAASPRGRD